VRALVLSSACLALVACGGDRGKAGDDDAPAAGPPTNAASAPGVTATPPPPPPAGADEAGLTADDEKLATGQFYDAFPLPIETAGDEISIEVKAQGFKPVLVILDRNQEKLSETEPLGANPDGSWTISFRDRFEEAGEHFVLIAAAEVGQTGAYSTSVQRWRSLD